jgi:exodeoxyribonuclease VII large subunit
VADVFVETPTAAAKIVADRRNALLSDIDGLRYELNFAVSEIIAELRNNLTALKHALVSPLDRLQEKEQFLDELQSALNNNVRQLLNLNRQSISALIHRLEALSPLAVLFRGYSLSMLIEGERVIKDAAMIKRGDKIKTILSKGSFISLVEEVKSDEGKTAV